MGQPFEVGRVVSDVFEDVDLSLIAHFDLAHPHPVADEPYILGARLLPNFPTTTLENTPTGFQVVLFDEQGQPAPGVAPQVFLDSPAGPDVATCSNSDAFGTSNCLVQTASLAQNRKEQFILSGPFAKMFDGFLWVQTSVFPRAEVFNGSTQLGVLYIPGDGTAVTFNVALYDASGTIASNYNLNVTTDSNCATNGIVLSTGAAFVTCPSGPAFCAPMTITATNPPPGALCTITNLDNNPGTAAATLNLEIVAP
jgi:hypothetical protein